MKKIPGVAPQPGAINLREKKVSATLFLKSLIKVFSVLSLRIFLNTVLKFFQGGKNTCGKNGGF
jgi:hypothetical protein